MTEILAERDLRALIAVVEEGRRDEPTEGMPWAVLHELAKLVRGDHVTFAELDPKRRRNLTNQEVDANGTHHLELEADDPGTALMWHHLLEFMPYRHPLREGDPGTPVRWTDYYTPSQLRNTPVFAEVFRPLMGSKHNIGVFLPTAPGHTRRINIYRDSGADFTERDRLVLQLLRPHLHEVYLDAQRRSRRIPRLSRREEEVLRLAQQGYSNSDIARELFISLGTVRKHMEHIFDRTGVRSRTAAAARVLPQLGIAEVR